jgi:hypothetical protein
MKATIEEAAALVELGERMIAAMERGRALHVATARRLRREARAATRNGGHTIGRFSPLRPLGRGGYSEATCRTCGAWLRIETAPAPNSIDVSGAVFSESCTGRES